ncbi:hypothetical protein FD755_025313 [Muntiacus reevesi]|uniref:HSF-type DNA-binding domain-containing protein n=1 Tax=Muntiacus reevesi TaxID=9886 RepID=A0A5N3UND2_MUNRE|nr:hypothetical protein FD755_025313 [Muntiacus reevesi]
MGHHSFRLLLKESAFQALSEEPLLKRPHTKCGALPGGEGSLLSLHFPRKRWTVVNSHHFVSIWWEEDGTCIGVNEELFKNILERVGSDKIYETDCMKSFVCQISLYGFSKACQDVLTSLCLTSMLTEEPAGHRVWWPACREAVCKDRTGDQHVCRSCQCCVLHWGVVRGRS